MFERFSREARRTVELACEEAILLRHGFVGTEHLLLGLLEEDHSASRILEGFGVTKQDLLEEYTGVVAACGFPRDPRPDPDALSAVGIDLDEVRRRVEGTFGRGALERTRAWRGVDRPPFTPRAKRALHLALRKAVELGDRRLQPTHLLLGLAAVEDGLAARLLARRGLTRARLRAAVMQERRRSA